MKTFGKYQLREQIGQSPSRITYRAYDSLRDRELELKVFRPGVIDPAHKDSVRRRLAECLELSHPHIAKIHDIGEVVGEIYIAREWLPGTDLKQRLIQGGAQTLAEKLRLMAQVCDGLAHAHSKQIIHGNLKPGNIFVTESNEAKLVDFAVADLPEPSEPTPDYMAPEQILKQPADAKSDVFSAAAILYEFLVNPLPRGSTLRKAKALRKLDARIPEELEQLVAAAMEADPQQRLPTAQALAAGLCAIAEKLEPARHQPSPILLAASAAAAQGVPFGAALRAQNPDPAIESPRPMREETPLTRVEPTTPGRRLSAKRLMMIAAAAALGICGLIGLQSRSSSRASTLKPPPTQEYRPPSISQGEQNGAVNKQHETGSGVTSAVQEAEHLTELALNSQITPLYEAGRYTQALKQVDAILITEPTHAGALAWKKKIREAQDAEAALR